MSFAEWMPSQPRVSSLLSMPVPQLGEAHTDSGIGDLVSFRGQSDLLRASTLGLVMQDRAAIFNGSEGTAETYALSEAVAEIDVFISHNWVVPRLQKFCCLAVFFNFHLALLVTCVATVVIAAATGMGLRPCELSSDEDADDGFMWNYKCNVGRLLVAPIFLVTLLFGHILYRLPCCRKRSPTVFLDKTCINQVDGELQRQGILKLGAFIRNSSSMVVVYTDIYLSRLWTVYEIACFLVLHPKTSPAVVPTYLPTLATSGILLNYVLDLVVTYIPRRYSSLAGIVALLSFFYFVSLLRNAARTRLDIYRRMADFDVEKCKCANEDDRALVYRNIALLMFEGGAVNDEVGRAGGQATDEAARGAFNEMVRDRLPNAFTASVGRLGISYAQVVAVGICAYMPPTLDNLSIQKDLTIHDKIDWFLVVCTHILGLLPLMVGFFAWWCGLCLHLEGLRENVFLGSGCVLTFFVNGLLAEVVEYYLRHFDLNGFEHALPLVVLTLLAIVVFDGKGWQRPREACEGREMRAVRDDRADEEMRFSQAAMDRG